MGIAASSSMLARARPGAGGHARIPSLVDEVRGILRTGSMRHPGQDSVTVPASTLETEHYRIMNTDLWISGEDRILVKQLIADEGKEYILTQLEAVTR